MIPKKYFHDRLILLLLTTTAFLTILVCVWVVVHLSGEHASGYIVQYRANLGIDAFKTGSVLDLLSFVVFSLFVFGFHTALSIKTYTIHRQLSIVVLCMALVLLVLALLVSNSLLVLR